VEDGQQGSFNDQNYQTPRPDHGKDEGPRESGRGTFCAEKKEKGSKDEQQRDWGKGEGGERRDSEWSKQALKATPF